MAVLEEGKSYFECTECGSVAAFAPAGGGWALQAEYSERWVRAVVDRITILETRDALLVLEGRPVPRYFIPKKDVKTEYLRRSDFTRYDEHKGTASFYDIVTPNKIVKHAVFEYETPEEESAELVGYVHVEWDAADHWYEEEEEVFRHARNPHKRIDAIASSRHVQVILNGQIVADSHAPVVVFETGITPRYYLPREDVRREYFHPTTLRTRCPYKGEASYQSAEVDGKTYENVVWGYRNPYPEVAKIRGLWCFYNERVDALLVDGVKWEPRPDQEQF